MAAARTIKWAQVEYQPNLQLVAKPVPLGIIAEEVVRDVRMIMICGREPLGNVPGLQLDEAWGPFREGVGHWIENLAKTVRESVSGVPSNGSVLDAVAERWKWNVYLRQPTESETRLALENFAERRFKEYIAHHRRTAVHPSTRVARLRPWIRQQNQLQVTA